MIARTLRAIAHEPLSQIAAIAYRRIIPHSAPHRSAGTLVRRPSFAPAPFLRAPWPHDPDGLTFLARRMAHGDRIDWRAAQMPRLWRFRLHSFDWLRERGRDPVRSLRLIGDWIASNPPGTADAWEAYTASRRIGNWIDLFARRDVGPSVDAAALSSLAHQVLWLENNLERHLRANHFLENGRALVLASAYFDGRDADRWRASGVRILMRELDEQILSDGGHIERSPMYHALVLEGLLDLLNVAQAHPGFYPGAFVRTLRDAVRRALTFLAAIELPGGALPRFNDSADGEAASPSELYAYGRRTGAWESVPKLSFARPLDASGYYVVREGDDALVADCGPLGAPYLSGHGHADTLGYEYVVGGRRIVADTGVFGYEPDERRRYARSARAHAVILVDDEEPCELWGAFRVGRRAEPLEASLLDLGNGMARFAGAHDGFVRLPGRPIVHRSIKWNRGRLAVIDEVRGRGRHRASSIVPFASGLRLELDGDRSCAVLADESVIARVSWDASLAATISDAERFPAFGAVRPAETLVLSKWSALPLRLGYTIDPAARDHDLVITGTERAPDVRPQGAPNGRVPSFRSGR